MIQMLGQKILQIIPNFKFAFLVRLIQEKNSDKENWVYNDYGIIFDGVGSWNFGNGSHTYNCKNAFQSYLKVQILILMKALRKPEINYSINFSKAKTRFYL